MRGDADRQSSGCSYSDDAAPIDCSDTVVRRKRPACTASSLRKTGAGGGGRPRPASAGSPDELEGLRGRRCRRSVRAEGRAVGLPRDEKPSADCAKADLAVVSAESATGGPAGSEGPLAAAPPTAAPSPVRRESDNGRFELTHPLVSRKLRRRGVAGESAALSATLCCGHRNHPTTTADIGVCRVQRPGAVGRPALPRGPEERGAPRRVGTRSGLRNGRAFFVGASRRQGALPWSARTRVRRRERESGVIGHGSGRSHPRTLRMRSRSVESRLSRNQSGRRGGTHGENVLEQIRICRFMLFCDEVGFDDGGHALRSSSRPIRTGSGLHSQPGPAAAGRRSASAEGNRSFA